MILWIQWFLLSTICSAQGGDIAWKLCKAVWPMLLLWELVASLLRKVLIFRY